MIENRLYRKDIEQVARILLPWDELKNKSFLITGACLLYTSDAADD